MSKKINIAVFGQGKPILNFHKLINNKNCEIKLVITHKKKYHLKDINDFKEYKNIYENIFDNKEKFKIIEIDKISNKLLSILKKNKINLILSCGSRFLFKKNIIKNYKNKIFNFHPSYLPEEQGGANFTYRILNKKNEISATLHRINEKIDAGDIVFQKKNKIKKIDNFILFKETYKIYDEFFKKLIYKLKFNKKIIPIKQKLFMATKNLKIKSSENGAINWSWSIESINNFIKAFGPPYSGAFSYIGKSRIEILESIIFKKKLNNEFLNGKVFKKNLDGSIIVYCKDGLLKIKKIRINKQVTTPGKVLKIHSRFFTPNYILEKALTGSGKINFK